MTDKLTIFHSLLMNKMVEVPDFLHTKFVEQRWIKVLDLHAFIESPMTPSRFTQI